MAKKMRGQRRQRHIKERSLGSIVLVVFVLCDSWSCAILDLRCLVGRVGLAGLVGLVAVRGLGLVGRVCLAYASVSSS